MMRRRLPLRLIAIAVGQAVATAATALLAHDLLRAAANAEAARPAALLALAAAVLGGASLRWRERVDAEVYGQSVAHDLRMALANRMLRLPSQGAPEPSMGGLALRFVGDLSAVSSWHGRGIAAIAVSVPTLAAGALALAVLDWRMAAALVALTLAATGAQAALSPGLRRRAGNLRRLRARLARDVTERAAARASVQVFDRAAAEARLIERRSLAVSGAARLRARSVGLMRAAGELGATTFPLAMIAIFALSGGADLAVSGAALTLGALLAPRVRELGRARELYDLACVAEERIDAFLARDVIEERPGAAGIARLEGRLALRGLALPGLWADVTAAAPPHARIVLTGANGAGKSRLLGVIAGLEAPQAGRVVIDGRNVGVRRLSALRRVVALAGAEAPLMRGSLDRNLRYGARLSGAAAQQALAMGGHDDLIAALPRGTDTRIGPGGAGLSAGQRARAGLLRALMRDPLILLLDEIDGPMDADGIRVLSNVFDQFKGTILYTSHDPIWQARADIVWRLEGGTLIASAGAAPEATRV
jgi:ABC-type multidrug transport system fused ATPase/permease subunit